MPQVVDLPPIGQRAALAALVKVCKDTPANGEPFRDFRSRLRAAKLWDRERPAIILQFLGAGGGTVAASPFMQALAAATTDEDTANAILDRVWELNPLLAKTVVDLIAQRAFGKDELYKILASSAYRGVLPSRPSSRRGCRSGSLPAYCAQSASRCCRAARIERYAQLAATLDADEFLEEDKPEPEPVIPSGDEDGPAAPVVEVTAGETSIPVPLRRPPARRYRRRCVTLRADGVPSPRGRDRAVPVSRFAHGFSDDVLDETADKIAAWWGEMRAASHAYQPADFELDAEPWVESADECSIASRSRRRSRSVSIAIGPE